MTEDEKDGDSDLEHGAGEDVDVGDLADGDEAQDDEGDPALDDSMDQGEDGQDVEDADGPAIDHAMMERGLRGGIEPAPAVEKAIAKPPPLPVTEGTTKSPLARGLRPIGRVGAPASPDLEARRRQFMRTEKLALGGAQQQQLLPVVETQPRTTEPSPTNDAPAVRQAALPLPAEPAIPKIEVLVEGSSPSIPVYLSDRPQAEPTDEDGPGKAPKHLLKGDSPGSWGADLFSAVNGPLPFNKDGAVVSSGPLINFQDISPTASTLDSVVAANGADAGRPTLSPEQDEKIAALGRQIAAKDQAPPQNGGKNGKEKEKMKEKEDPKPAAPKDDAMSGAAQQGQTADKSKDATKPPADTDESKGRGSYVFVVILAVVAIGVIVFALSDLGLGHKPLLPAKDPAVSAPATAQPTTAEPATAQPTTSAAQTDSAPDCKPVTAELAKYYFGEDDPSGFRDTEKKATTDQSRPHFRCPKGAVKKGVKAGWDFRGCKICIPPPPK